jgi:hypothetical protein
MIALEAGHYDAATLIAGTLEMASSLLGILTLNGVYSPPHMFCVTASSGNEVIMDPKC